MPPQMKTNLSIKDHSNLSSSPSQSPLPRSPRRVMINRSSDLSSLTTKNAPHTAFNEIRDSLNMPDVGSNSSDDDSEVLVENDNNALTCDVQSHNTINEGETPTVSSYNVFLRRKDVPMEQARGKWNSCDASVTASVTSSKSLKSTRSLGFFRRRQISKNSDDVSVVDCSDNISVAGSTKSRWWQRSNLAKSTNEVNGNNQTRKLQSFQSFRVVKSEKRSVRASRKHNDQLVADFFDVKSMVSEPDFVGTQKLRQIKVQQHEKKNARNLETRSVSSSLSLRSNVFSKFFLRMRAINDEVRDIGMDSPDLTGTGIIAYDDESIDDDITIGSGFDNLSRMGSIQDEYDDSSQGSSESLQTIEAISNADESQAAVSHMDGSLQETPFLHRIMQRRILKNESTILRDVVGQSGVQAVGSTSEADSWPRMESPTPRSRSFLQTSTRLTSSKSVGDLRTIIESDESSPNKAPVRGLCRWNSDQRLSSKTTAPKRPSRRGTEADFALLASPKPSSTGTAEDSLNKKYSPTKVSPMKSLDKNIKSSQSMRNLSCPFESKTGSDVEDDDDSILSLLSGLLATWSAERDGSHVVTTISQDIPENNTAWRPKSILKSFSESSEEQKIESRERYSVNFTTIEIREYERIVGDNPSCSKGPPISIGWEYRICRHYPINEYERMIRGPRRTKKEFHLAADKRNQLLINEWKCSEEDIRKARREATYIQYCRAKTAFSGSRAAAKEAAFLRKANDRSKKIMLTQNFTMSGDNFEEAIPKPPSRRPTIEAPPLPVRTNLPHNVNSLPSTSSKHKPFLEV